MQLLTTAFVWCYKTSKRGTCHLISPVSSLPCITFFYRLLDWLLQSFFLRRILIRFLRVKVLIIFNTLCFLLWQQLSCGGAVFSIPPHFCFKTIQLLNRFLWRKQFYNKKYRFFFKKFTFRYTVSILRGVR